MRRQAAGQGSLFLSVFSGKVLFFALPSVFIYGKLETVVSGTEEKGERS